MDMDTLVRETARQVVDLAIAQRVPEKQWFEDYMRELVAEALAGAVQKRFDQIVEERLKQLRVSARVGVMAGPVLGAGMNDTPNQYERLAADPIADHTDAISGHTARLMCRVHPSVAESISKLAAAHNDSEAAWVRRLLERGLAIQTTHEYEISTNSWTPKKSRG